MKKYIFVMLMVGLLMGCSNPADQKQPASKSEQPTVTQETAKPAAPPAPAVAPTDTKPAVESQASAAPEAAKPTNEPSAPVSSESTNPAVESQAPAAPHTSDVTSDKPVAGPGVTEVVKAPAGQEAPKTGQ